MECAKKKAKGVLRRWPLLPHVAAAMGMVWWGSPGHVAEGGMGVQILLMQLLIYIAAGVYICAVEARQRRVLRARIQVLYRQLQVMRQLHHPPTTTKSRSRTTTSTSTTSSSALSPRDEVATAEEEQERREDDESSSWWSSSSGGGLSVEAWLNGLLGAFWPSFEAGPLRSLLESKGREVLQRICGSNILLHTLRLGSSPPILLSASLPPPRHHDSLLLDFHLSFVAGEDMGVVLVLQPMGYFPTKLFCDELSIHCKVRIGLNFSNSIEMAIEARGLLHPKEFEIDLTQLLGVNHVNVETNIDTSKNVNVHASKNGGCYAILEILEGRNLMAKDLTGFSDPYVVVTQEPWALRLKTKTKKQTLNPSWRECFTIPLPPATPDFRYPSLQLRCRDRDLFVDDELGYYELDLNPYRDGKRHELVCKLKDADTGELLVAITVVDSSISSSSISSSLDVDLSQKLPTTRSTHPTLTRCGRLKRSSPSLDPDLDDDNIIDDVTPVDEDAGTIGTTTHQAMLQLQEMIGSFLKSASHPQTRAEESGGAGAAATSGRPRKRSYVAEEASSTAPTTPRRSVTGTALMMERNSKRRASSTSSSMAASMGVGGRRPSSRSMAASMYNNNKSSGDSSSRRSTDLSGVRSRTIRVADKDVVAQGPKEGG